MPIYWPVLVAERSNASVCFSSDAGIVGSNRTGGHGCLSVVIVVCCQVEVCCDGLIARPGENYRLWCVVVCDLKTS